MRNSYSKAVLRAACETVLERYAGFDYFPSYEIALSSGLSAFEPDNVHVRPAIVDQIIAHLSGLYLRPEP